MAKQIDLLKDLYLCSPLLNTECMKENCYINNGPCCHTVNKEYSQQYLLDYITNLQEKCERLKDIRKQAINYNKALCKIYDCGIELSNAETNLCILKDEETINTLQGKSDE